MRNNGLGFLRYGILALGGYMLYANRFKVQQFLESYGISTPWLKGSVSEGIHSGVSKVSGAVEHGIDTVKKNFEQTARSSQSGKMTG